MSQFDFAKSDKENLCISLNNINWNWNEVFKDDDGPKQLKQQFLEEVIHAAKDAHVPLNNHTLRCDQLAGKIAGE